MKSTVTAWVVLLFPFFLSLSFTLFPRSRDVSRLRRPTGPLRSYDEFINDPKRGGKGGSRVRSSWSIFKFAINTLRRTRYSAMGLWYPSCCFHRLTMISDTIYYSHVFIACVRVVLVVSRLYIARYRILVTEFNHRLEEEVVLVWLRLSQTARHTLIIFTDTSSTVDLCERFLSTLSLLSSYLLHFSCVGLGSWPWYHHLCPSLSPGLCRRLTMCQYPCPWTFSLHAHALTSMQPLSTQGKKDDH